MRNVRRLIMIVVAVLGSASSAVGQGRPADLRVAATGVAADGAAMTLACSLRFLSVPSNLFVGTCRLSVGRNHLTLAGRAADRDRAPAVVLHRGLTVRGIAEGATGRFASLSDHGASGFPVDLQVDPIARTWSLRGERPGGGAELEASGVLTTGSITLNIP